MSEPEPEPELELTLEQEPEQEPQPSTTTNANTSGVNRSTTNTRQFFDEPKKLRGFAKHAILKSYLEGWFPRMLYKGFRVKPKHLVYVDGFAGPGIYEDSEKDMDKDDRLGSPVLVYKALAQHSKMWGKEGKITLIFFEAKKEFYKRLEKKIEQAKKDYPICHEVEVETEVHHGDFNELMEDVLERFRESPMFIFGDPFGHNMKMSTLQKILSSHGYFSPRELLLNLMDGRLRSFIDVERNHNSQDELLGVGDPDDPEENWREKCKTATPDEKLNIVYEFYTRRLQEGHEDKQYSEFAPSLHIPSEDKNRVLKFAMKDQRNHHVYHLIYVTCYIKSFQIMKTNMSKRSQDSKSFVFSEWVAEKNGRILRDFKLDKKEIALDVLKLLIDKFSLPDQENRVGARIIDNFVWLDTPYPFNVKVQLRKPMKEAGIKSEPENGKFEDRVFIFPQKIGSSSFTSEKEEEKETESQLNENEVSQNPVPVATSSGIEPPPTKKRKE